MNKHAGLCTTTGIQRFDRESSGEQSRCKSSLRACDIFPALEGSAWRSVSKQDGKDHGPSICRFLKGSLPRGSAEILAEPVQKDPVGDLEQIDPFGPMCPIKPGMTCLSKNNNWFVKGGKQMNRQEKLVLPGISETFLALSAGTFRAFAKGGPERILSGPPDSTVPMNSRFSADRVFVMNTVVVHINW